jgi:hypothetical protein
VDSNSKQLDEQKIVACLRTCETCCLLKRFFFATLPQRHLDVMDFITWHVSIRTKYIRCASGPTRLKDIFHMPGEK